MVEASRFGLKNFLMRSVAIAMVAAPGFAVAAEAPADPTVSEVVVTASRISREGFVAPTPTTVLTGENLTTGGATNIGSALTDMLPGYAPSVTPTSTRRNVATGQNTADLRALGPTRTLVLIDGARPVTTAPGGAAFGFDLNMIPTFLVKKVDVVTGGASAQWGSDAVAGVINVVLDNNFNGLKASIQAGGDTVGLGSQEWKGDLAFGTQFAGGRGHLMAGIGYDEVSGVYPASKLRQGTAGVIPNPDFTATNGQPQALFVQNLLNNNASVGGLITLGPLKGTNFGPGGSVGTFQYGQYGLLATSGSLMVGGDPTARQGQLNYSSAIAPLKRTNFYGRATYDVSDRTTLSADVLVGRVESDADFYPFPALGNLTIQNTNAFLPAQIVAAMAANKITNFRFGRINEDFGSMKNDLVSNTQQVKFGARGDLGSTWNWDGFYSYGQTKRRDTFSNQPIAANLNNSINSIKSPTTGLPICAIALTDPSTSCVPVNLFGPGSVSSTALAYFMGSSVASTKLSQHEVAFNVRGDPFSLWAGPVSIAAGVEYRYEGVDAHSDPITQANGFAFGNIAVLRPGHYDVTEGYVETVVPLLKDQPLFRDLTFNGAARISDYSSSGTIPSWKAGLTDEVAPGLRLRAVVSRDVRAPNLNEFYTLQTTGLATVINPTNNTSSNVVAHGGGNPNLDPEKAKTWTFGATYQPPAIPGLDLSVDYYSINIHKAIGTLAPQTIVTQCFTGKIDAACNALTIVNGAITEVQSSYINLASYKATGVDMAAEYSRSLSGFNTQGRLDVRWLGTYVDKLDATTGTTVLRLAGAIADGGLPRWRSTLTATYQLPDLSLTARARYVGGGLYSRVTTVNVDVPTQVYFDMEGRWKIPHHDSFEIYGGVNNVFDKFNTVAAVVNGGLYSNIGRTFFIGLRAKM
jgi:iron complex outermembrane receptor protein